MTRIANDNADNAVPRTPDDDVVQPFQLEVSGLRGRVVRLGPALNRILAAHEYPRSVAHLLAETVATSLLLSSMLKYEGVFTLQTSAEGPVRTMVADVTTAGAMRGYASYSADLIGAMEAAAQKPENGPYEGFDLHHMTGKGYLAFTVDQGAFTERYQGIVSLSGQSISDAVRHYFDQSEQIGTSLKVVAGFDPGFGWRAGAIMIQRMPDPSLGHRDRFNPDESVLPFRPEEAQDRDEDWNRAVTLMQSVTPDELLTPDLHSHDVLLRLFHEEGVRIFTPQTVQPQCRCSEDRVRNVLATLPPDDRDHAAANGVIEMTCEFCCRTYRFRADDLTCVAVDEGPKTH
ncbi:MAG: Hsp33 family molecular chaperone HslO [Rhodospirillales bacterium]|nr:Hsp33 family molecular chaperone HslO [Alphaproteobacteria bacterium]MCB9986134.1 Hsp33 family molecular chaperone HslO [Rhodospirillales bacterium]USO07307.1 MAG: Hsp33 family molecular chaperone HslO [Rhodospirillales bacterium]